jgi:hypothetical protein
MQNQPIFYNFCQLLFKFVHFFGGIFDFLPLYFRLILTALRISVENQIFFDVHGLKNFRAPTAKIARLSSSMIHIIEG